MCIVLAFFHFGFDLPDSNAPMIFFCEYSPVESVFFGILYFSAIVSYRSIVLTLLLLPTSIIVVPSIQYDSFLNICQDFSTFQVKNKYSKQKRMVIKVRIQIQSIKQNKYFLIDLSRNDVTSFSNFFPISLV